MTRTSKLSAKCTVWGLLATLAATVAAPVLADPQSDKNNMRNLAIAGAAVAGYGLLNHNNTATLLGAAGAALAGSQYEKDRKQQSQNNDRYGYRRYHRTDNNGYNNNGSYGNSGSYGNNGSYGNSGYNSNSGQWRNDYNSNNNYRNGSEYDNNGYGSGYGNAAARHDNGRHLGWTKHHGRDQDRDDQH